MSSNSDLLDPRNVIALVGAPNAGKTTLYNWLTNSKFKTVNYPGATVEYSLGRLAPQFSMTEEELWVMDTPGTYSLFPKSADEEVTLKALYSHPKLSGSMVKVIVVVDGTQMARHLLLAKQVQEAGFSLVIALTMVDLLRKNSLAFDFSILEKEFQCPVIPIEGLLAGGVDQLVKAIRQAPLSSAQKLDPWTDEVLTKKTEKTEALVQSVLKNSAQEKISQIYENTARWDRLLLHPIFGMLIFVSLMFALFSSIFWIAKPFMDSIDTGFSFVAGQVTAWDPQSLLVDFFSSGVIKSIGSVLIFVPQIFILFLGIGILESSGYLARAATLIDRPFSKIGMSGRSFVPILSGYACAVPAIMATRNISSARDRWITSFIIPLMSCSARLPVYALLLTFLFQGSEAGALKAGLMLTLIYMGSLLLGAFAAWVLHRIIQKSGRSLFMMELPIYRRPVLRTLISGTYQRTWSYVQRAGPAIFLFSVLIWAGSTFPNSSEPDSGIRLQSSYLGKLGQQIEPIFTPMGGDWRTGVGLLTAFAAREVFVSSMSVLFNITDEDENLQQQGLIKAMGSAKAPSGGPLFTVSSVLGLVVFVMIALQCLSTFAISAREMRSWKFASLQLLVFNVMAYVLAVGLVQGLRAIGVS